MAFSVGVRLTIAAMSVVVRPYLSPTLVLLALDWARGETEPGFLGFAIKRSPGFFRPGDASRALESWLPNRITFDGAVPAGKPDAPTRLAPVQKFMWWDARIEPEDRKGHFVYTVYPVVGTPVDPQLLEAEAGVVPVTLPDHVEAGIGTWFNRAVLSSQAFNRQLSAMHLAPGGVPSPEQALALREWLANDLQLAFSEVLRGASKAVSAVYHLTDPLWVRPQLEAFARGKPAHSMAVVYDAHRVKAKGQPAQPTPNAEAIAELRPPIDFYGRDRTAIMHNKFIVTDGRDQSGKPSRVLMGSANFTTGGLTTQSNLLHVFDSVPLAQAYNRRAAALAANPTKQETAGLAPAWSPVIELGKARIRVSFSPEPRGEREQTDTVIAAIRAAKRSVLFCLFTPTDQALRKACFDAGDRGLMMFGLVNRLASAAAVEATSGSGSMLTSPQLAGVELFHRSRENRDVVDGRYFSPATVPAGFEPELRLFPGEAAPPYAPVVIHHKFIVVDAEGSDPIVYTGSANMSDNSEHNNDENVLEIRHPATAGIYLAEFMRLYEHYRARALRIKHRASRSGDRGPLKLSPSRTWADKYYVAGSPEAKARVAMSRRAGDT